MIDARRRAQLAHAAAPLAPAAVLLGLTLYLGFQAGGYFPGPTGLATVVVAILLVLRVTMAPRPFEGIGPLALVAIAAMALFSVWTLASAAWSDASYRAIIEFDRALLYTLTTLLFASFGRTPSRFEWMLRAAALGFVVICTAGLLSRLAPDVFDVKLPIAPQRLSFPLTYWNTVGLCAALATVFCLHLSAYQREPRWVRVLAAALVPGLAATLILSFSRGGIVALGVGIVVWLIVARPPLAIPAAIAVAPALIVAITGTVDADLISSRAPTSAAAVAEGHDLATTLALCTLFAGALRAVLLPLDRRLEAIRIPDDARRPARFAIVGVGVFAALLAVVAFDLPDRIDHQYDRFVAGDKVQVGPNASSRLTDVGNNGRIDLWKVSRNAFEAEPLRGSGAGTFRLVYESGRPDRGNVSEGHSVYLEVAGELGVVGIGLLLIALGSFVVGLLLRSRGRHRVLYGAAAAATIAWLFRAGIDWDWEMPAVTLWLFALGGAAVASQPRADLGAVGAGRPVRLVGGAVLLALAIGPGTVALSQNRMNHAFNAFRSGDCARAIDRSLAASSAFPVRPEPFELIGYCDVRFGRTDLAIRAFEEAIERDPDNWRYHYGLALTQAIAGQDPRAEAARAHRLNSQSPLATAAVDAFEKPQRTWERSARALPLPGR